MTEQADQTADTSVPAENLNPPENNPAPTEPPDLSTPESISMPKDAFNKRLEQAQTAAIAKFLKAAGYDSPEAFAEAQKASANAIRAAEEAKRAEMSELEKFKTDLAAEQKKRTDLEASLAEQKRQTEALEFNQHIHKLCRERGIQNVDFAMFKISQAVENLENDAELNEIEFLDNLAKDEAQKAALGLSEPPPKKVNANTTSPKTGPDPKPNDNEPPFNAMTATPEQIAARYRDLGFHG